MAGIGAVAVTAEKSKDVLDELWNVAVEEMNFLTEAANLEEFARRNKEVAYVGVSKLYHEYTNQFVLVMEQIEGYSIDDKKGLLENGYEMERLFGSACFVGAGKASS